MNEEVCEKLRAILARQLPTLMAALEKFDTALDNYAQGGLVDIEQYLTADAHGEAGDE